MISRALTVTFLAFLGAAPDALAGPAGPVARTTAECTNKDETALLHHRITLPPLSVWDAPTQSWRGTLPNEGPSTAPKIRIVHMWGTWCLPCKEEFPVIKQMDMQIRSDYHGDVQFVYVADTLSSTAEMKKFMDLRHMTMPLGLLYHDDENKLGADLLSVLPQREALEGRSDSAGERQLLLPITLLVDQNNIVRQAFVGSLLPRRADLVNGIAQLHKALTQGTASSTQKVAVKKGRTQL